MRVFLDTNVLASAFGSSGVCAELFREVVKNHELLTSDRVIIELERILPDRFGATRSEVRDALHVLRGFHIQITPADAPKIKLRDPDDLWILAAAIAARADVLVTGDKDLLTVAEQSPVKIVNPRGFLEML